MGETRGRSDESALARVREWLSWHSVRAHVAAPIWVRVPEKWRWAIVYRLDRSRHLCWSSLVEAALTTGREDDACDVPTPLGCGVGDCATTCHYMGGQVRHDHEGVHDCRCYCGKFQFLASEGADDRRNRPGKPAGDADA